MLKFTSNFIVMFLFVFVGGAGCMGALFGILWVAVHFGGGYAIPGVLLAVVATIWGVSFAASEQSK